MKRGLGGRVRLILSGAAPLSRHVEEYLRVVTCSHVLQGYGMLVNKIYSSKIHKIKNMNIRQKYLTLLITYAYSLPVGLTETCAGSFVSLPNNMSMLGTVGPPVPYVEVRLESVPEMGYDALSSETPRGEICIRGDTLFSGYYKREDLTKEVMVDGWFHTGINLSPVSDGSTSTSFIKNKKERLSTLASLFINVLKVVQKKNVGREQNFQSPLVNKFMACIQLTGDR